MSDINQCELWSVSDVKKTDGIPGKESYRVDFSAKLTLKGTAEDAMQKMGANSMNREWMGCLMIAGRLMRSTGALWKSYDVTGAGEFVKSEKGWRLLGELGEYDFVPAPGQRDSDKALSRPVEYTPRVAIPAAPSTPAQQSAESAPIEAPLSPCIAPKMKEFGAKRSKELAEASSAAQAAGDELKTSAGMESISYEEALKEASIACNEPVPSAG